MVVAIECYTRGVMTSVQNPRCFTQIIAWLHLSYFSRGLKKDTKEFLGQLCRIPISFMKGKKATFKKNQKILTFQSSDSSSSLGYDNNYHSPSKLRSLFTWQPNIKSFRLLLRPPPTSQYTLRSISRGRI